MHNIGDIPVVGFPTTKGFVMSFSVAFQTWSEWCVVRELLGEDALCVVLSNVTALEVIALCKATTATSTTATVVHSSVQLLSITQTNNVMTYRCSPNLPEASWKLSTFVCRMTPVTNVTLAIVILDFLKVILSLHGRHGKKIGIQVTYSVEQKRNLQSQLQHNPRAVTNLREHRNPHQRCLR